MKGQDIDFNQRIIPRAMAELVHKHDPNFEGTLETVLSMKQPAAWRATWVLGRLITSNDSRIQPYIGRLLEVFPKTSDGHQRELLKILEKMEIPEKFETAIYDICLQVWQSPTKIPSVRITAFRILVRIATKYPELVDEIMLITEPQHIDSLSPGVRNSYMKLVQELKPL